MRFIKKVFFTQTVILRDAHNAVIYGLLSAHILMAQRDHRTLQWLTLSPNFTPNIENGATMRYLNEAAIDALVEDLTIGFEMVFNSGSSIGSISPWVTESLQDEGISPKRSLVLLISKRLKLGWMAKVQATKRQISYDQAHNDLW